MDNPTLVSEFVVFLNHTASEPDLSYLVIEEDGNIERETWASEMWESNLSGTKSNVQEWNVKEDSDKNGLENKSEVTHGVDHTLLREGEVSGLADHEVSPLDANDGYEVA